MSNEITKLEKEIIKHKILYYQGHPEISDHEYDQLEEKLKELSPTSRVLSVVGSQVDGGNEKVQHKYKMLSLNKTYHEDELKKWIDSREIISLYKIDGVSCSLVYEQGVLKIAKTRGDGTYGEDITDKVMWMKAIPQVIPVNEKLIEIRGELFCYEEQFLALRDKMEELNLEKPTNQRNIVAGLIGRKENLGLCSYIDFQAFDIICESLSFKKEREKFVKLDDFGFDIPEVELHKDDKNIQKTIEEAQKFMSDGDFQIDGIVFVVNDIEQQNELGETSHHPRYKIAFKFKGESKTTSIEKILWQVSRNGILTPVAQVKPIEIGGARVSKVTLHNYGMVKQFKLKEGDLIQIIRSGEVIPKFLSVVESSDKKQLIPEKCPSCESQLNKVDIRLVCINKECPDKNREMILNFIKKIGIDDLSSKRLDEMMRKGLILTVPDLYKLTKEDFLKVDKVKEKLASKLYNSIQKTKNVDLVTFLSALGLAGGARNKCEKIVFYGYDTLDKIMSLSYEKLEEIETFADKSARTFIDSLDEKKSLINELLELGLTILEAKSKSSNISGNKICITGPLSEKRSVIEQRIRDYGGVVVNSVSKATDFLITNEQEATSTKHKKALKLEIPILTEEELKSMILE